MKSVVLSLFALIALAAAKPQYVEWFEMKPARTLPHQTKANLAKSKFASYYDEWESFKQTHKKVYESNEMEASRFAIFQQNVNYIKRHNELYNKGHKSYYLGVNQFADMKVEEFRLYNGLRALYNQSQAQCSTFVMSDYVTLPDTVDWREKGAVTPVKNQGQCGSCWSFSTTGSLEGQHFLKSGDLKSLSEQQLVDCSGKFGNEGCNGGLMDQAFEYIISAGGIDSESEYPYDAKQERCHFKKSEVVATCSGCVDVASEDEDALKKAVGSKGPVSVAIDASHQSFQLYKGGVYDEPECSSTQLDHGVLAVGYGTDDGQDYWLVKNSWGTTWGEDGYVKMTRNKDNQCGIATQASYPLV